MLSNILKPSVKETENSTDWSIYLVDEPLMPNIDAVLEHQKMMERIGGQLVSLLSIIGSPYDTQLAVVNAIFDEDDKSFIKNELGGLMIDKTGDVLVALIKIIYNAFSIAVKAVLNLMTDYLGNFFSASIRLKNAAESLLNKVNKLNGKPKYEQVDINSDFGMVMTDHDEVDIALFTEGISKQIEFLSAMVKEKASGKLRSKYYVKKELRGNPNFKGGDVDAFTVEEIRDYTHRLMLDTVEVINLKRYTFPFLKSKSKYLTSTIKEMKASNEVEAQKEVEEARNEIDKIVEIIKSSTRLFTNQNKARYQLILLMAKNIN